MKKPPFLPDIPEQDQTPLVKTLLGIIEKMAIRIQQHDEEITLLKDEINILKGEKKRPVFKGSKLDIRVHTTRYRLEHWVTPENQSLTGKLPA